VATKLQKQISKLYALFWSKYGNRPTVICIHPETINEFKRELMEDRVVVEPFSIMGMQISNDASWDKNRIRVCHDMNGIEVILSSRECFVLDSVTGEEVEE
jgi:hypothetical protein